MQNIDIVSSLDEINVLNITDYVRRYGNSSSIALFDPSYEVFSTSDNKGILGYRLIGKTAIVFGDPVAPPSEQKDLALSFVNFCKENHFHPLFVSTSEEFSHWALHIIAPCLIEFGIEQYINPQTFSKEGPKMRLVRKKINAAQRAMITIHEYLDYDPTLEKAMNAVCTSWLRAKRGSKIFLTHIRLFDIRVGRRWFFAKHNNEIIGVIFLHAIDSRSGWFIHSLVITPDAPSGTSESLIVSVVQLLKKEGCSYLTFGTAAANSLGEIQGLSPFGRWLARKIYKLCSRPLHFHSRLAYRNKFQPLSEKCYLLFSRPRLSLQDLWALAKALHVSL